MKKTVIEIAHEVRSGTRTARAVLDQALAAIEKGNERINAFVHVGEQLARQAADRVDEQLKAGVDPGPLAGVPFGIKDLRDRCAGMPCTKGSLFHLDDPPAERDSGHVARLRAAGAVPVGMVASAEFGMDGVTHTLAHGTTRNPWNTACTPSGSSGGSSAAVSAGLVPLATGSDGGGSIRCPAGYTGTVGLKSSQGRVARDDGSSDRTCLGALTTTVADTARYLDVAAGPDDRDRMSLPVAGVSYEALIETLQTSGLRAVWSPDLGFAPVDPEVAEITADAAHGLINAAGMKLLEESPVLTNIYLASNMFLTRKFVDELEYRGILPDQIDRLSPGPRAFVEKAQAFSLAQMFEAQQAEGRLEQEVAALFSRTDVLLTPCHSVPAYAAEGPLPEVIDGRDASQTHAEPFTMLANVAWNPSISVPAGITASGLPVGLLITGPRHRDDLVLRLARILEQHRPWPRLAPGWS